MFSNFYDFCEKKRIESKEKYISEGNGIGSAMLRKMRDKEKKNMLEMRIYNLMQTIHISNAIAAKEYGRNSRDLIGFWKEDMNEAEKMLSYLKQGYSSSDFINEYGEHLAELEKNYQ